MTSIISSSGVHSKADQLFHDVVTAIESGYMCQGLTGGIGIGTIHLIVSLPQSKKWERLAAQSMFEMLLVRGTSIKGKYIGLHKLLHPTSTSPRSIKARSSLRNTGLRLSTEVSLDIIAACLSILGTPLLQRKFVTRSPHRPALTVAIERCAIALKNTKQQLSLLQWLQLQRICTIRGRTS